MLIRQRQTVLFFMLSLSAIYAAALYVVRAPDFFHHPGTLSLAVTLDLTVLAPLLYYLWFVRGRSWPLITVVPVFLLSLWMASLILPSQHQAYLRQIELLIAPVELLGVGFVVRQAIRVRRRYRQSEEGDFFERLRDSLRETTGSALAANALVFELAVFYYALLAWRTRIPKPDQRRTFSYHEQSGYGAFFIGMLLILMIETAGVHSLLQRWSETAAWVMTALSGYGLLWLTGDFQALRRRPIVCGADSLQLRIGLRGSLDIPFTTIARVRRISYQLENDLPTGCLKAVVMGDPQLVIDLKEPMMASGPYGLSRKICCVALAVDDPASFERALKEKLDEREKL
jgi:hypothetical protein